MRREIVDPVLRAPRSGLLHREAMASERAQERAQALVVRADRVQQLQIGRAEGIGHHGFFRASGW